MKNLSKSRALVIGGCLVLAAWAVSVMAQDTFTSNSMIESTTGGFKFPDGTVQTTAITGTALVPRTGQSAVFASGDDGDLQLGVTWPNPRFTINQIPGIGGADGTVTDDLTGLVWLRDANCFGGKLGRAEFPPPGSPSRSPSGQALPGGPWSSGGRKRKDWVRN